MWRSCQLPRQICQSTRVPELQLDPQDLQISRSPDSPDHQITKSPNHHITKSPNHQITKSPHHQIHLAIYAMNPTSLVANCESGGNAHARSAAEAPNHLPSV